MDLWTQTSIQLHRVLKTLQLTHHLLDLYFHFLLACNLSTDFRQDLFHLTNQYNFNFNFDYSSSFCLEYLFCYLRYCIGCIHPITFVFSFFCLLKFLNILILHGNFMYLFHNQHLSPVEVITLHFKETCNSFEVCKESQLTACLEFFSLFAGLICMLFTDHL